MASGPFRILVTRTEPGASRQANALRARGLQPVKLPLIETEPVIFSLGKGVPELVVVLSAHAVEHGAEAIRRWGQAPTWLAIGETTAHALEGTGIQATRPNQESSEGLLETRELVHCQGRKIAILSGVSPRPLLREVLEKRGAEVAEYPVYRRLPVKDISDYHEHLSDVSAVIVSSVEGLHAFADVWRMRRGSNAVMLCVNSTRAARVAARLGFENLRISSTQSAARLADAVRQWLADPTEGRWHE